MTYDIITYCSENYKDCFNFSIDSWLKTNARRIYIYTDGWSDDRFDNRVQFINISDKESNWVENVGKKLICIDDYWYRSDTCNYFCFLDMDNYITADISEIFENTTTVSLTRIDLPHKTVSAGNVFFFKNDLSREFLDKWIQLQNEHRISTKYHEHYRGVAHDQTSLHELTWNDLRGANRYNIVSLVSHIYNAEHNDFWHHKNKVTQYKSKIIHFKDQRWKNQQFVNEMKDIISKFSEQDINGSN